VAGRYAGDLAWPRPVSYLAGMKHSKERALTGHRAYTAPDSGDARLRGRTYAVPFDTVWRAALGLVDGGLRGWSLTAADDEQGKIEGSVRGWFQRFHSDVVISISLDRDAQTRVDAVSESVTKQADVGTNARRLVRFFRSLDRAIEGSSNLPISSARVQPAPWK
jgi:hypothetical protein